MKKSVYALAFLGAILTALFTGMQSASAATPQDCVWHNGDVICVPNT